MTEPLYRVRTWDSETQEFTPQEGLVNPSEDIPILGVRRVLRELQRCGYECYRNHCSSDSAVLVERVN